MIPRRYHCTLVEAPDQHGMLPTSSQDILRVFHSISMLQMGSNIHHHAFTIILFGLEILMWLKFQVAPEWEMIPWRYHCTLVEAPDQHGMLPTSTQDIHKVIDNIHMLQMGRGINHYALTTTLLGINFQKCLKIPSRTWMRNDTMVIGWSLRPTWNASHILSRYK
jgi:hypothetical protein